MTIFRLFDDKIQTSISKIRSENERDLILFHEELQTETGEDVTDTILKEIALKRLLECYTTDELIKILKFYELI